MRKRTMLPQNVKMQTGISHVQKKHVACACHYDFLLFIAQC